MNKKKIASKVAEVLQQNDVRKSVPVQKMVLHVSDDDGNHSDFTVRKQSRGYLFDTSDVSAIIDAFLEVMEDCLSHGEEVYLHGFGAFNLQYHAARSTRIPTSGEWVDVDAHFVPKFTPGKNLRSAAKLYELSLDEVKPDETQLASDDEDEDGD